MPKDLFSSRAGAYARFRPHYPLELFQYILSFVPEKERAWDCATGNGQAASVLSEYFRRVDASDISQEQLNHAVQKPNLFYHLCPAEQTPFEKNTFNLITIATAYHWLDHSRFETEARRVGRTDAVIAAWSYNLLRTDSEMVNGVIDHFYHDITGPYWDAERKHVDNAYSSVDFPFSPLPSKEFEIRVSWTLDQLTGYLSSWSGVANYEKKKGASPLLLVNNALQTAWGQERHEVRFPLFLRLGRL